MVTESDKSTFLSMIEKTCIDEALKNKISASVIASIGIVLSNWGTTKEFYNTRNIYLLPADNDWKDKCYSKSTETIYDKITDCNEENPTLYRVYSDHRQSIKDFINKLLTTKRVSENGPLKYKNIIGIFNHVKAINILVRAGFVSSYLEQTDNNKFIKDNINIIENYKLYEWDNIVKERYSEMAKKKKPLSEEKNEKQEERMYRVRLEWDQPETQIFSSMSYKDALHEARKHKGYKIYIGDDGELFTNPWKKEIEKELESEKDLGPKPILHAIKGEKVILNKTPVYKLPRDKEPMARLTGEFYFYDSLTINNRGRITTTKEIYKNDPNLLLGYIDLR